MLNSMEIENVLEERYTHSIMISLYENKIQKKTSLLSSISKSSCIGNKIDMLEDRKLVKITVDRFNKNTKWVELTPKGEEIAKLLLEIKKLM